MARVGVGQSGMSAPEPIAIVGIACRFPGGADTPVAFWELLRDGRDAVTPAPPGRFDSGAWSRLAGPEAEALPAPFGGFLPAVDGFDARFFGVSPREAESMDPQHRLLLEVAWEALEDAGLPADGLRGSATGVFVGVTNVDYTHLLRTGDPRRLDVHALTGSLPSGAAGRLSHALALQGPSLAVDTACSSSLVAVHLACQSLRAGEGDLALAAGVNLLLAPEPFACFARWGVLSPDGRTRAFDAAASGFARAEGGAVLILERLADARRSGHPVRAVIRGSAVNQDGASAGLTVPSASAQRAVIQRALAMAGVAPGEVSYVEAHGTGTPLGDAVELEALDAALGEARGERPLPIGSVKTNLGSLESAAGMAGLVKAVLALEHEAIPPHLHFTSLTPKASLRGLAVLVPTRLTPWPSGEGGRVAGVSAFGLTGTNAHLIVQEAPHEAPRPAPAVRAAERPLHLLALSAKSEEALRAQAGRMADHLAALPPAAGLADVCFSAATARPHLRHRLALVAGTSAGACEALAAVSAGAPAASVELGGERLVPLRSPGRPHHGAGPLRFLHALSVRHDVVRGRKPRVVVVFPDGAWPDTVGRQLRASQPTFRQALQRCDDLVSGLGLGAGGRGAGVAAALRGFALGYALAEVWSAWGVAPAAVAGQGMGEFGAARAAGVLDLPDALRLLSARAVLDQALAGETSAPGSTAPARAAWEAALAAATYRAPAVDLVLTGASFTAGTPPDLAHWRAEARATGDLVAALARLRAEGPVLLLALGPGLPPAEQAWLTSLGPPGDDWRALLEALAALHVRGVPVDWIGFDRDYARRRVPLPAYAFRRQRYWVTETPPPEAGASAERAEPAGSELTARVPGAIHDHLARALGLPAAAIAPTASLAELGVSSLAAASLAHDLERDLGVAVSLSEFLEAGSVDGLAALLLDRLGRERSGSGARGQTRAAGSPLIGLAPATDAPLSFGQERLWFLDRLAPGNPAYHIPLVVSLDGRLDRGALEGSLAEVVRRHEPLRTAFPVVAGHPVQRVAPPGAPVLATVDLTDLPPDRREAAAACLTDSEARRPFTLAEGPPIRATLLTLGETRHQLLVTLHHIAADACSVGVLLRELAQGYEALVAGRRLALPDLPVRYADIAIWQRQALSGAPGERVLAYWRARLGSALLVPALPGASGRDGLPRSGSPARVLPAPLARALAALGRPEGATLFMTLLAGLAILLNRRTGGTDVILGTHVAGRTRPEAAGLIGFFVNTVPLRLDLSGDPSGSETIRRARGEALAAYAHQELPFEKLVEALRLPRQPGRAPLPRVLLNVVPLGENEALRLPGLTGRLEPVDPMGDEGPFDLTVHAYEGARGIRLVAEHRRDAIDGAAALGLLDDLAGLLEALVREPGCPIGQLALPGPADRPGAEAGAPEREEVHL